MISIQARPDEAEGESDRRRCAGSILKNLIGYEHI